MPWVKIKPGRTHGVGDRYHAGDVFEATADEARDFADKFSEVPAPVSAEPPALPVTAETVATEAPAPAKRRAQRAGGAA